MCSCSSLAVFPALLRKNELMGQRNALSPQGRFPEEKRKEWQPRPGVGEFGDLVSCNWGGVPLGPGLAGDAACPLLCLASLSVHVY